MAIAVALVIAVVGSACDGGDVSEGTTTTAAERPLVYVALGDSYSSGEGAEPYDATPASCHRSATSWTRQLDTNSTDIASLDQQACSGARVEHLVAPVLGFLILLYVVINADVAAQTLGFVWLGIGVVLLVFLLATGRRPDLSAVDATGGEPA